ncbi:hypothetical protein PsYK624_044270 [Phanerochaete sordida]|uniref:F-box domain-containing protein n=1 Tax=Phanerochaete sordida TaxID=48140 RepID=A0A9P3LB97_9APHY|nr:hypothetical protein PsYK624_044270 [Phanerochaete sordida]
MPALHSISLPPPLSQRKRVQRWAIILRGLDDASRRQCALVSRTFRYAIYLSAIHIIDHDFRGKRTLKDMKPYSHAMTNFWPYLRLLQEEAAERERIYSRSVLGRLADSGRAMSISPRLWGCPDHDSQAAIASRFVFTSFWFAVSIGGRRSEDWLRGTVVDAQEVVPGEIWSIAVQYLDSATNTFRATRCYVLEPTCEVIGTSAELPGASIGATHQPRLDLRVDWSAYIDRWARDTSRAPNGLFLQHLNWANHEEYDRGISKLWTKRTVQEGALGQAKRAVAERYIFACVVANSVSGVWMSATEMAQDFAGLPSRHAPAPTKTLSAGAPVNMFLPATHHVESVHFTTSSKLPLHPALAVVQTPAREYFVLRDNGFEVGSEEEGVAPLWREILCCDSGGLPTKPVQPL